MQPLNPTPLIPAPIVTAPAGGGSGGGTDVDLSPQVVADAQEVKLTTTAATTIDTYTPKNNGNFKAEVYVRVATAATNVTVTATYADAGGAQTYYFVNNQSLAVGSHTFVLPFFNAVTGTPISINVTAGTANQVFASSSIEGVTQGV